MDDRQESEYDWKSNCRRSLARSWRGSAGEPGREALTAALDSDDPEVAIKARELIDILDFEKFLYSWDHSGDTLIMWLREGSTGDNKSKKNPYWFMLYGDGTIVYRLEGLFTAEELEQQLHKRLGL